MKRVFFFFHLVFILNFYPFVKNVKGQAPSIQWQKALGGNSDDDGYSIQQTSDGGYIVAGSTNSLYGDVTGIHTIEDYWVVKLSATGNIQWQKALGGSGIETARSIQETVDGGYIIAGYSSSNDGDVSGHNGSFVYDDYWIVKIDITGNIQWQKSLGGTKDDYANSIQQTSDGGYIIAGESSSNDGDVSGNHGWSDFWIVKLSSTGNIQWQRSLGGSDIDYASCIQQTSDGGYIAAGSSWSNDGDVSGNHGDYDYWIVKLSDSGVIQWQKCFGGSNNDYAKSLQQISDSATKNGGYVVAGESLSNDGDVSGNHGGGDYWIIKLSPTGNILWQKTLGGSASVDDIATSIQQTWDLGYIVAGSSSSNDGNVTENHGYSDFWIVKLSEEGNIIWQKCYGGSWGDFAQSIRQTTDSGYIIVGSTYSRDGNISNNKGAYDYWVVKLNPDTVDIKNVSAQYTNHSLSVLMQPNPTTDYVHINGAGKTDIKVYDIIGNLMKVANNTDNISLSEFPIGMYFIRLFNNQGEMIYTDKIIKQ